MDSSSPPAPENSPATILVVDDTPNNVVLVADVLSFEGYRILTAVDAESAQEMLKAEQPDLILMDIALPGMDGLTLTRKLKTDKKTSHIAIIALTSYAMKGDDQKAMAAGCDGYITKPFDIRKLASQVAEHLTRLRRSPPPKTT
jgi:CheY-like chemotaxis protein